MSIWWTVTSVFDLIEEPLRTLKRCVSSRFHEINQSNPNRIVRLMEAKTIQKLEKKRMIDIIYTKEADGDSNVDVSF